ncbi:hypothetical protein SISNIDRAFT_452715 [Sistotremastrum niveocremeum HHB9708]|uniref:Uncharacterized protein n=1 Tax=Sistotremastrum niveocremeum HHB9708 TaxID=1314777 RepID=A0A164WSQ6_9AGAM|nr:hypothetical protein SISNIDRAFT_452715 [Sistotremastrum niveocremeum HHB9708]
MSSLSNAQRNRSLFRDRTGSEYQESEGGTKFVVVIDFPGTTKQYMPPSCREARKRMIGVPTPSRELKKPESGLSDRR